MVTGRPAGGEEAEPERVHGHRLVQPEHGVAVVLAQRPDHRDGPVCEQHVRRLGAPVPWGEGRGRLVGHVPNVPERAVTCQRLAAADPGPLEAWNPGRWVTVLVAPQRSVRTPPRWTEPLGGSLVDDRI